MISLASPPKCADRRNSRQFRLHLELIDCGDFGSELRDDFSQFCGKSRPTLRTGAGSATATEFVIGESGKLYLAAILDLFSRFVVGWAVSAVNDRRHTLKALGMALKRCCPAAGLLHHCDEGWTYASEDYQGCSKRTASRAR